MEDPTKKATTLESGERPGVMNRAIGERRVTAGHDRRRVWGGRFFGMVWLVVYLPYPINAILGSNLTLGQLIVSLAGMAVFAGVWAWLVFRCVAPWTGIPAAWKSWTAVAALTALALAYNFSYGAGEFYSLFIFASIAAGLMLLVRGAYAMIGGLTVLAAIFGWTPGEGWLELGSNALAVGGLGVAARFWSNLAATNAQLRQAREEIARLAVAEERLRFARDLHDLLGHSLSLIALKTDVISRLLPDAPEKAAAEVRDAEAAAREALQEVRAAVAGYRRPTLVAELAAAREVLGASGIRYQVEGEEVRPAAAAEEALAWAVREGVTNVVRHSRARRCVIRLELDDGEVSLEVADDGVGMPGGKPSAGAGSGLAGLEERVAAAGGTLEAGPGSNGGFRLRVTLPVAGKRTGGAKDNGTTGGVSSRSTAGDPLK